MALILFSSSSAALPATGEYGSRAARNRFTCAVQHREHFIAASRP
jgi:hypothetical protein